MLLSELVQTSRRLAATPGRNEKVAVVAELLRRARPEEVEIVVAWLAGRLRQGRIGAGPALFERAASDSSPRAPGLFDAVAAQRGSALTLAEADAAFERLSSRRGSGSSAAREEVLRELLGGAGEEERNFLFRLAMGELRQGALGGVMEEAVAVAAGLPVEQVRRAAMLAGNLGTVARAALTEGAPGLARFGLTLLQPVHPMLAQPAEDLSAALERLGEAALEPKLDGARVQIHRAGKDVRVFSRSLHDVTRAAPELVELALSLPARELVLDGEVLALDRELRPHPFQVTMRRFGRKLDVERLRAELPLTPFLFDLLWLDGADLLGRPTRERIAALGQVAGRWAVERQVTSDLSSAERFYDRVLAAGHEGIMAKSLEAPYLAGARGFSWLKLKPAHTLDLVVLAAEWGHGRRSGWLSNLHLGARDPAGGGLVMLGKTFKGMTDEMLAWQTEALQRMAVAREGHVVHVRPELVVEVAFGDVQESPQYPGGLALRFARVKRYRPDKPASEADTLETVRAIARGQVPKARRAS